MEHRRQCGRLSRAVRRAVLRQTADSGREPCAVRAPSPNSAGSEDGWAKPFSRTRGAPQGPPQRRPPQAAVAIQLAEVGWGRDPIRYLLEVLCNKHPPMLTCLRAYSPYYMQCKYTQVHTYMSYPYAHIHPQRQWRLCSGVVVRAARTGGDERSEALSVTVLVHYRALQP